MPEIQHIIIQLRRLNDLQAQPLAAWAALLEPRQRTLEIERARHGLPTSLLGHHDRIIARGQPSLAQLVDGCCGACGARPARDTVEGCAGAYNDLDVCDNCGVFLECSTMPGSLSGLCGNSGVSAIAGS